MYFQVGNYIPVRHFQLERADSVNADAAVYGTTSISVNLVELFDIVFAKYSNDFAVFESPMLKNFRAKLTIQPNIQKEKKTTLGAKLVKMVTATAEISPLIHSKDVV
jgi:hypothetical protein